MFKAVIHWGLRLGRRAESAPEAAVAMLSIISLLVLKTNFLLTGACIV